MGRFNIRLARGRGETRERCTTGKAERKDCQIDNDVWHVIGRTTKDDKNGLLNRTGTIKFRNSTAIRRAAVAVCCARVESGQKAAALTRRVMNSRRLIVAPRLRQRIVPVYISVNA
jgi:hypothetical protein